MRISDWSSDVCSSDLSVWRRIAIVAASPAANLLVCVLLLWAMFVVGRPGYATVVGHVDGIAAESGLRRGDTVLAVGDRVFQTWDGMQMALLPHALDREDVELRVRERKSTRLNSSHKCASRMPSSAGKNTYSIR